MNWKEIRNNYPLITKYTYLDNARTGAISTGTADALKSHIDDFLIDGALHREQWIEVRETTRKKVAMVLDVEDSEIGFLTDVSTGMSLIAAAMKKYQKVLLVEDDFPSVGIPWIRSGFDITWVKKENDRTIDLHKIEEALKKGIDVLSISWVQYNSGFRINLGLLGELCSKYTTRLIVDGTQGFCALPVAPAKPKVHVFVSSAFKWMTSGYGIAVIYIDPELQKELEFQAGGWNNLVDFFGSWEKAENYKNTAEFIELAHPKYANLITLNHALGRLQEIGLSEIQKRTMHLSKYLQSSLETAGIETLSNFSASESSSIRLMRGNLELFKKLESENIKVTFREDYFRVAPHFYNDEADIDKLIQIATD